MTTQLGTVSHGTLLNEDLIPAFYSRLEDIIWDEKYCFVKDEIALIQRAKEHVNREEQEGEEGNELVNDLIDALNQHAPPFCYFGANEGDGSDYGFWVDHEALRDAIHDGEVLHVVDGIRNPVIKGMPEAILHTSDHGDNTLYSITKVEVW